MVTVPVWPAVVSLTVRIPVVLLNVTSTMSLAEAGGALSEIVLTPARSVARPKSLSCAPCSAVSAEVFACVAMLVVKSNDELTVTSMPASVPVLL